MEIPLWFEIGSLVVLVLVLVADLLLVLRRPHVPSSREAALWVGFYIALALVFALILALIGDIEHAGQFLAGWLTEYSLSIDNLFVFLLIMGRFAVPRAYQQEVLMVGIIIALVLRGIFIVLGVQLIENFTWLFYLFGAFLLITAGRQLFSGKNESQSENEDNRLVRYMRHHLRLSKSFDGRRLRTTVDGRRVFTPMLLVFLAIGSTDLLFALDSIPAIFGITTNAFLVFAANIFALMGLRQLYFLLGNLLAKLEYLTYGIVAILGFIGVKLVFHALHENEVAFINGGEPVTWVPEIGTWESLAVILGAMVVATVASLLKLRITGKNPTT